MNGLGKPFRKKPIQKFEKNSEHQSEIVACDQKTTSEKANFCSNTVFSLAFSLDFLFRRDQNHDFKKHENV